MRDPLAGMDAIGWAGLRHAYGSAEDVPGMLRDLYLPEKAARASDDLLTHVHHQGGCVVTSAAPAVPYVLRAAAEPGIEPAVRQELVELLGAIAHSGNTAQARFVDRAWPAAWDLAVTGLLPLLDAPEAAIRLAAADALAEARHRADEVLTALRTRWAAEPDADTRHQLVDSVGSLTPHSEEQRDASLGWLRGLTDGGEPAGVRLAAVKALHTALRGQADDTYARTVSEVLLGSDPATWQPDAAHVEWTVARTIGLLNTDPTEQITAIRSLLAHPDAAVRTGALKAASDAMSRRRSAVPALLPTVAPLLSDPEPGHRLFAARVLGMCGPAARPWADVLAVMVTDEGEPYPPAQDHAVWALSRLGDARCVPPLVERLAGERLGFADHKTHADGWWTYELSLVETAGGLAAHADVLLPPLRSRLAAASTLGERRALCQLLERWGPASAPAIPELLPLLDTDCAVWALDALAAIGPRAAEAVPRERLRALLPAPSEGWSFAGPALALAYGRLTGDREPALALLLPRMGEPYGRDNAVTLLGELGPAGAPYVQPLRALLTRHRTSWLPLRVGAALWRITGETDEVVPVLVGAIEPFAGESGKATRAVTETIRLLGEIGPPAAEAAPFLRRFLDADERPVKHGTLRSVPDDDELRDAACAALLAITRTESAT
ncbi:HEAT repeat domain-containing protein [Streptomyces sp. NPDC056222]|uniref:HEAT repeat domain-containing protein n=1 Tax=Streptomyces sp. NPDC056222 TaxID=3345749 RepID=UPI0035DBEBB5